MLEITYRLFEMLALVVCLHSLNGEKLKIDVYNVGFVGIEMAFMQMIQEGIVSEYVFCNLFNLLYIRLFKIWRQCKKNSSKMLTGNINNRGFTNISLYSI